jgi:hypothetical protein
MPSGVGRAPQLAAKLRRRRPSAADWPSTALPMVAASPQPREIKSNLIKLLKEICGEEMKSGMNFGNASPAPASHSDGSGLENMDKTLREQPKRPTKVALNSSSDIFALCSKLQIEGT